MSEDETLRLAAQVVDKFSGPIRDMQRSLRSLSDQVKGSHKAGTAQAKEHAKAFDTLHHSIRDVSERVRGALNPAMAAFGVGALSAAGGVAAVTAAIKDFAGTSRQLSDVSKEVGISIQQLRVYEALASRVGSSAGAMDAGLENFAKNMEELRRNRGELQKFFIGEKSPGTRALGETLRHTANNADALKLALEALGRVKGPDAEVNKRNLLEKFGLPLELARKSGQELKDLLEELNKTIKPLTEEEIKRGKSAQQAFDRLRESVGSLRDEVGAGLAPAITRMTDSIRQFVEANRESLIKLLDEMAKGIEGADWKGFAENVENAARKIRTLIELKDKKLDWDDFMNLSGLDKTFETFKTYWKVQWGNLKDIFGNGNKESPETKALREKLRGQIEEIEPGAGNSGAGVQQRQKDEDSTEKATRKGVKDGFLDGLREGFHRESYIGNGYGGANVIRANYGGGGGGGGGAWTGGGGAPIAPGHSAPMGGGGAPGGSGTSVPAGGGGGGVDAVKRALQGGGGGGLNPINGRAPASVRYNNPGAQWPSKESPRFGMQGYGVIGGGNQIARFPTPEQGAASNMALFDRLYVGKTLGYALGKWSNQGYHSLPGYGPETIVTHDMLRDPNFAIPFFRKQSTIEAGRPYPMSDEQWQAAHRMFMAGGSPAGYGGGGITAAHKNAFIAAARAARAHAPRGGSSSSDIHAGLLGSARSAGMFGGQSQKVTGDASLRIDLNGFPRGTRTASAMSGMFKEVSLNRGRVPYADQEA